jgi:hypothetical protein
MEVVPKKESSKRGKVHHRILTQLSRVSIEVLTGDIVIMKISINDNQVLSNVPDDKDPVEYFENLSEE